MLVVLEQGAEDELDRHPGVQLGDGDPGLDLAEHDHLLGGQLHRGDRVGLEGLG